MLAPYTLRIDDAPPGLESASRRRLFNRPLRSDAWWLATTNRWRTTPALHRSPTKPVLCSRIREHCKTGIDPLCAALPPPREAGANKLKWGRQAAPQVTLLT